MSIIFENDTVYLYIILYLQALTPDARRGVKEREREKKLLLRVKEKKKEFVWSIRTPKIAKGEKRGVTFFLKENER